jgi:hypothetical protein
MAKVYKSYKKTKNSTETTRNSRKQQYCCRMEEHQNHNLTGSKQKFGKIQSIYKKEKKIVNMGDKIK